jgi:NADH dehydrogenase [ubiquinone] 1 alpha subcomplex assembly factor 7
VTPLAGIIARQIAQHGPMRLDGYMALCLCHPDHGYYTGRDPLGVQGDFTTAPEISQMFGELIGLWLAQSWLDMGAPDRVVLAELGPGRGTLMADALRAAGRVPGFLAAAGRPVLIEISPVLRTRQAAALAGHDPIWADRIEDLPGGAPLLLIANEFFDALPIRQLERRAGRWRERVVTVADGALRLGVGPVIPWDDAAPDGAPREIPPEGALREVSSASEAVAAWIGARLAEAGGAALIVDYGYDEPPVMGGDTFQALARHEFADPFADPGTVDLTAHVHFGALARAAAGAGAKAWPLATQGALLERLGVGARAVALIRAAGDDAAAQEAVVAAHRRLSHPEEMGTLFKALALTGPGAGTPPGF